MLRLRTLQLQEDPHVAVEDLGPREIDGRSAVGFLAKKPHTQVTIWADAETGLPVRIEQDLGQIQIICKNLQFDAPLDESLFSMEAPEGYRLKEAVELDLGSATESDFIEGLRVMAELFGDSQFPDGVSLAQYLKRKGDIFQKCKELHLSDEHETVLGIKLQKYVLFIRFFQGQGKWYYRGRGVTLGEGDVPIFWYHPKNSARYRVIYGDLHVEDAALEDLPEPLDADDVVRATVGYEPEPEAEFAGRQIDVWQVRAGGQIVVRSNLTLTKGPEGVETMPVVLPYATAVLTCASVPRSAIPFCALGPGLYQVELPLEKLAAGPARVTCIWTLPLTDLEPAEHGYQIALKSLIPVVSYKVIVVLEADSGLEFAEPLPSYQHSSQAWVVPFAWDGRQARSEFGSCGLNVRKCDTK